MRRLTGYGRPRSLDELWDEIDGAAPAARLAAGCTDLIPKSRAGAVPPARWIDVRAVPELSVFQADGEELRLGACLTHDRVGRDPLVRERLPGLAAACGAVGSRQIRALGTLGGNVANASPCADSALALAALSAVAVLRSRGGTREVPVEEVALGPGETLLEMGEVLEAFRVPMPRGGRSAHLKLGPRRAHAVAKVSVAASGLVEGGGLTALRLFMGSVAPTLIRVSEAEATVVGMGRPDEASLAALAAAVEAAVRPIDDVRSTARYRRRTSGALARRAVEALLR